MTRLLKNVQEADLIIVVSAMAKTTNSLELLLRLWHAGSEERWKELEITRSFHQTIVDELFQKGIEREKVDSGLKHIWDSISSILRSPPEHYSSDYDRLVSNGELISTQIISHYLNQEGLSVQWKDCRELIVTDSTHRNAKILWEPTQRRMKKAFDAVGWFLTQGFIGADLEGRTTTLGREGSDYSAAAISYALDYDSVTIWKDVPGIKNGDPKVFEDTILLNQLSYEEAIELAYYGASVIHPKTIQPLQRKSIPLYVKSFLHPENPGTTIGKGLILEPKVDCFIRKENQWWLRISTRDLAFIAEDQLSTIYLIFYELGIRINLSTHTAVSSSFCFNGENQLESLLQERLESHFALSLLKEVSLYTVRHSNKLSRSKIKGYSRVLHEQSNKDTFQLVVI